MEFLFVLLVLGGFAAWVGGLSSRVKNLEAALRTTRQLITDLERRFQLAATPPSAAVVTAGTAEAAATEAVEIAAQEVAAAGEAAEATKADRALSDAADEDVAAQAATPETPPGFERMPTMPGSRETVLGKAGRWSRQHWPYLVGAVSLALAGIFLVQFGLEQGLIGPETRIVLALLLGVALLGISEFVRRRWRDAEELQSYAPVALAAAGLVVLFGAIWGAYRLYGLISPELAFAGLAAAGFVGLILGWIHGPLLAAVGLLGSAFTPFLIGGGGPSFWLNYYYAIILVLGLAIDSLRHWGWVSYLAQVTVLLIVGALTLAEQSLHQVVMAVLFFVAATALPRFELWPSHAGPPVIRLDTSRAGGSGRLPAETPQIIALLGAIGAILLLAISTDHAPDQDLWRVAAMCGLLLLAPIWTQRAPASVELSAVFVAGLAVVLLSSFASNLSLPMMAEASRVPGLDFASGDVVIMSIALGAAVLFVPVALWRGERDLQNHAYWVGLAAVAAPLAALVLDVAGDARALLGHTIWAAILSGLAAVMVLAMSRVARRDPEAKLAISLLLISAFGFVVFALVTLLSSIALTLALMAVVLAMIFSDDRFDLPLMEKAAMLVLIAVSVRLVLVPGVYWAVEEGAIWEVVALYAGVFIMAAGALIGFRTRERPSVRIYLESIAVIVPGLMLSILVYRWLDADHHGFGHLGLGLVASVWLTTALAQSMRMRIEDALKQVRLILFLTAIAIAGLAELAILTVDNPVFGGGASARVQGQVVVNSLLLAFALPALLLFLTGRVLRGQKPQWTRLANWVSFALFVIWLALNIRFYWHGADIGRPGIVDGELYNYTIAMIAVSGLQLLYALYRRRSDVRYVALVGLGVVAAKVFVIDTAGLAGLYRVGAFLALGFVLIGLAWLNGRFATRFIRETPEETKRDDAAPDLDRPAP